MIGRGGVCRWGLPIPIYGHITGTITAKSSGICYGGVRIHVDIVTNLVRNNRRPGTPIVEEVRGGMRATHTS